MASYGHTGLLLECTRLDFRRIFVQVCIKAGLEPSAISYIEAHGTGTVAGDGQELGALEEWYGRSGNRTADDPLLIGSVKSNMGHCEGCSGLAGEAPSHSVLACDAAQQQDTAE